MSKILLKISGLVLYSLLTCTISIFAQSKVYTATTKAAKGTTPLMGKLRTEGKNEQNVILSMYAKKEVTQKSGFKSLAPFKGISRKSSVPVMKAPDGTILYGTVIFSDNWTEESQPKGIYSFPAQASTSLTGVAIDEKIAGANGVYVNGKYCFSVPMEFFGMLFGITYYVYNAETWELESEIEKDPVYSNTCTPAITYDPVTDKVYALSYNDDATAISWSTMNPETGDFTQIAPASQSFFTLSADSDGKLYGIAGDGILYSVNKNTGAGTAIGPTGITPKYAQSAAFDLKTKKLYWASMSSTEVGALYEVSTATGAASLISNFPYNEEITGLFVKAPLAEDGAPAAISDLRVTFNTPGSLDGKILFTAPAKTFSGGALSGTLDLVLKIDDVVATNATSIQAGSPLEYPKTLTQGEHTVIVQTSNSVGPSPKANIVFWAGKDAPVAVPDLKLSISEIGLATLTWKAPTKGIHNGYIDPASFKYKVTRYPSETVVAENLTALTFSEQVSGNLANYSYSVTVYSGNMEGQTATSNSIIYGSALNVPYLETFDNAGNVSLFTIIDGNNDESTWIFDKGAMKYEYNSDNDGDDWLITPPINLDVENVYKLSFKAKSSKSFAENLKVTLGTSNNPATHTTTLIDIPDMMNADYKTYSVTVKAPAKGEYNIGFYDYSLADQFNLYVDSISLVKGASLQGPAAVTELKAVAAPMGEMKATISFKAPTKTYNNAALSALTKIEIYRGEALVPVQTFTTPAPGASLTWTDANPAKGTNIFKVLAFNEKGQGEESYASVFVGIDIPNAVGNLKIVSKDNTKAVLTWEAPATAGVNGGYINPSALTYTILRYDAEAEGYVELEGGTGISALTFTDETAPIPAGKQDYINYGVIATSETGPGAGTVAGVVLGTPYVIPYVESFAGGKLGTSPWLTSVITGTQSWFLTTDEDSDLESQDGDGGLAVYLNEGYTPVEGRLLSPKVTLKGTQAPFLSFWMYHTRGVGANDDNLKIEVSADGGNYTQIGETYLLNNGTQGWEEHKISLEAYKNANNIILAFRGFASKKEVAIYMDNISIDDNLDHDLAIKSITAPAKLNIGSKDKVLVTVKNRGQKAAPSYSVELYTNSKLTETKAATNLAASAEASIEFPISATIFNAGETYSYTAKVVYAADMKADNNTSQAIETTVPTPKYPKIEDLAGSQVGSNVALTWSEPSAAMAMPVTDDIESYQSFDLDVLGAWATYDGDGQTTYSIQDGPEYANQYAPGSYQVWVPSEIDLANESWQPHSGTKCLISWGATGVMPDKSEVTPKNNDWLISPEIVGGTALSFWATEPVEDYGAEKFEILYSSTTRNSEDFTLLKADQVSTSQWTEFTYTLPENAKYFAIRYVSADVFALLLDDITYTPVEGSSANLELRGYHIYRDGVKITTNPIGERTYTDVNPTVAAHVYYANVVYDLGESALSNRVEITVTSGINSITSAVSVLGKDKAIVVKGAEGFDIGVYTASGMFISQTKAEGTVTIPVTTGVYLVKVGDEMTKVVVK